MSVIYMTAIYIDIENYDMTLLDKSYLLSSSGESGTTQTYKYVYIN